MTRKLVLFGKAALVAAALFALAGCDLLDNALGKSDKYTITGTIEDANDNPVSGAEVMLKKNGNGIGTQSSSASGTYTFTDIEEGSYTITVTKSGYKTKSTTVFQVNADYTVVTITLTTGEGNDETSVDPGDGSGNNTNNGGDEPQNLEEFKEFVISFYNENPSEAGDAFELMDFPRDPNNWTSEQWEQAWEWFQEQDDSSAALPTNPTNNHDGSDEQMTLEEFKTEVISWYNENPSEAGDEFASMGFPRDPNNWTEAQWNRLWDYAQIQEVHNGIDEQMTLAEFKTEVMSWYKENPSEAGDEFASIGFPRDPNNWTEAQWEVAWKWSQQQGEEHSEYGNSGAPETLEEFKTSIISWYKENPSDVGDEFASIGFPRDPNNWTDTQWEFAWEWFQGQQSEEHHISF
jgi:hypothetical protein